MFSEGVIGGSNIEALWGMIAIRMLTCTRKCWRTKNQAKKFTRQFSRLLTPAPSLSVFHGNLPHRKSYVVLRRLCL